jgi:O-antigen/teichoic acid export membrane protein
MLVGVSAILIFRVGSNSIDALLKAFFQHRTTNLVQVIYGLIRPACVAVSLLWSRDIKGVIVALILAEATLMSMLGISLWRYMKSRRWEPSGQPVQGLWGRFTRFAATVHCARLLRSCVQMDVVVIFLALALPKPELALIAFAYNLLNRFLIVIQRPVMDVLQPYFNFQAAKRKGRDVPREVASLLSKGVILVFVFSGVGLLCLAPRLIRLLFPPEFSGAVAAVMILMAFFFAERPLSSPAASMLFAYERNKQVILAEALLLLNVPLMFAFYNWFGVVGPALSAGILRFSASLLIHFNAFNEFSWSLPRPFLLRVGACALFWGGALALGLLWAGPGWGATIAMGIMGGLLLVPCMAWPRWFTTIERNMLLALEVPGSKWLLRLFRFEPVGSPAVSERP